MREAVTAGRRGTGRCCHQSFHSTMKTLAGGPSLPSAPELLLVPSGVTPSSARESAGVRNPTESATPKESECLNPVLAHLLQGKNLKVLGKGMEL